MVRKNSKKKKEKKVRIIPIGGLDFVGLNCTAIEYDNQIIIIDAGIGFPTNDQYGVDCLIPNPKYLKKNSKKIKGLLITHGHQDHIGAIPYLIRDMGFPTIYTTKFVKDMVLNKFKSDFKDLYSKVKIKTVSTKSKLTFGSIKTSFFGVNHSIPEAQGVIIKTPAGTIVHTGDFKFDNSPLEQPCTEYSKIAKVGAEGVLCLLSDSTNSYEEGHCMTEREIGRKLEDLISEEKGRVIIATFSSLVTRVSSLLKIARKYKRKVFVSGRSLHEIIKIAKSHGYIDVPESLFIKGHELKDYKDNQIMVLSTGSQGETMAALSRMARKEHREIKIKDGDTVILSASVIPGNGAYVQDVIDSLTKFGANVYHNDIMNLHTTGHAHKEEQKLMIRLTQPKYFMPVHGYLSFLSEHAKTAEKVGIKKKNIIMASNGDVIEMDRKGWKKKKKIYAKPVLVAGSVVGDVGATVLEDRHQLANYGVFVFILTVDKKTKKLIEEPKIISRGFVYMKYSKKLMNEVKNYIKSIYSKEDKNCTITEVKERMRKKVRKFLYKKTEREPMVLPVIHHL
ncbi:RNase J family beta-CASP ribonuclease [Candidatus Dojkabacteria bacterium]|nr:RNase J family beta-CASP ribonuclease [Candidatus Dojkabacteria bacterium]